MHLLRVDVENTYIKLTRVQRVKLIVVDLLRMRGRRSRS